jgi:phosphatidylserine decarboxylase
MSHQYVERDSRVVYSEEFYGDKAVRFLYSRIRENAPLMFRALTGARMSRLLSFLSFNAFVDEKLTRQGMLSYMRVVDPDEWVEPPDRLDTLRKIFERKIRYWECRPMPTDPAAVVSPCDARMLVCSFDTASHLFIKDKFFDFEELLGRNKKTWLKAFEGGDYAIFRLTPEKYHYNHAPVAGRIVDFYQIPGMYNACHPDAVVTMIHPYSKNKRIVTIINTDVPGGTMAGMVAMVEVVALMIGDIVQCYSEEEYINPVHVGTGLFMRKGCPKSLFRPGSSTVVLIFQKNRISFAEDIVGNMQFPGLESIFTRGFGQPLVETEIMVRSAIGTVCQDSDVKELS